MKQLWTHLSNLIDRIFGIPSETKPLFKAAPGTRLTVEWEGHDTLRITSPHLYNPEWASKLFCDILEWSIEVRAAIDGWMEETTNEAT